ARHFCLSSCCCRRRLCCCLLLLLPRKFHSDCEFIKFFKSASGADRTAMRYMPLLLAALLPLALAASSGEVPSASLSDAAMEEPSTARDSWLMQDSAAESLQGGDIEKRPSFVRLGKRPSFVRLGKRPSFVRLGKRPSFCRLGKRPSFVDDWVNDRALSDWVNVRAFVRLGKRPELCPT
uniref:Secreted protein n=1 Tax=Macrostomum lignano TaxID=282301 RepID=A0A1I8FH72_9PLAT